MPAASDEANPIQMNIFGAQSLPASPVSAGSDWDTPRFPACGRMRRSWNG